MSITLIQSDGLHIAAKATPHQLAADKTLLHFAGGFLAQPLAALNSADNSPENLSQLLHHAGSDYYGLITAFLVLDAEITAVVDDEARVFPLAAFLSYRSRLPLERVSLNTLRLPPLNPDGHYIFAETEPGSHLAARVDIHPELKVAGHVRLAVSNPAQPPLRLRSVEHRLERRVLEASLLETALATANEALSAQEQASLKNLFEGLVG